MSHDCSKNATHKIIPMHIEHTVVVQTNNACEYKADEGGPNIHHELRLAPPLRVRLFEEALYFSGSKLIFDIKPTDGALS